MLVRVCTRACVQMSACRHNPNNAHGSPHTRPPTLAAGMYHTCGLLSNGTGALSKGLGERGGRGRSGFHSCSDETHCVLITPPCKPQNQPTAGGYSGMARLATPITLNPSAHRSWWPATSTGPASGAPSAHFLHRDTRGALHVLLDASTPPGLTPHACSAGANHTCGLLGGSLAGRAACFGASAAGQLGDGNLDQNELGSTPRVRDTCSRGSAGVGSCRGGFALPELLTLAACTLCCSHLSLPTAGCGQRDMAAVGCGRQSDVWRGDHRHDHVLGCVGWQVSGLIRPMCPRGSR